MRVAVIGGKLQGVEAAYLAKKAGWEVVLIDKEQSVPAAGLCDCFFNFDVNRLVELMWFLKDVDLIIPAMENKEALGIVDRCARYMKVPIIYDAAAYAISSSKITSNEIFARIGIPAPSPWPECGFPIIVKPSGTSGSEGVIKINDREELQRLTDLKEINADWVIAEYLEGASFSLEVIGYAGNYKVLQITKLSMDEIFDCKRVIAPVSLAPGLKKQFEDIALNIAGNLNLNGMMDVEAILHNGELKVLEIDARLPSQTPTAVFKSTGLNMVEILGEAFVCGKSWPDFDIRERRGVVYEHIMVSPGRLASAGEHIMAEGGPLHLHTDFFGADEAITNYAPGKTHWVATLITTGADLYEAWDKRCAAVEGIRSEMRGCECYDEIA